MSCASRNGLTLAMEENVELFPFGILLELSERDDLLAFFCAHCCRWLAWLLDGRPSGMRSRKGDGAENGGI